MTVPAPARRVGRSAPELLGESHLHGPGVAQSRISLLRYEVSIRFYGALSTTIRYRFGWIKKNASSPPDVTAVENEGEFLKVRRRSWARPIA